MKRDFKLKPHPRSDGKGLRYPVKVRITDALELTLLDMQGHRLDGRRAVVREARKIFAEHIAELGGVEALSARQRRELEIIVRQVLIGRYLSDELINGNTDKTITSSNSDRILLDALQRAYR